MKIQTLCMVAVLGLGLTGCDKKPETPAERPISSYLENQVHGVTVIDNASLNIAPHDLALQIEGNKIDIYGFGMYSKEVLREIKTQAPELLNRYDGIWIFAYAKGNDGTLHRYLGARWLTRDIKSTDIATWDDKLSSLLGLATEFKPIDTSLALNKVGDFCENNPDDHQFCDKAKAFLNKS